MLKETDIVDLEYHPVTARRCSDLETLFDKNGVCEGCLGTWWKLTRSQFFKQKNEDNRKALANIAVSRDVPGIWAYYKDAPVEWCAVAPREPYPALMQSRVLERATINWRAHQRNRRNTISQLVTAKLLTQPKKPSIFNTFAHR